jgi:pyridoxamine 5'-phosphate oxidase
VHSRPLDETDAGADPFVLFDRWFSEASRLERLAGAAALATATAAGVPSVRMMHVVAFDAAGLVFYSDYSSRKAHELLENPQAALLFNWDALGRQVRFEGEVERLAPDASDRYAATRPREALLVAHASRQSAPVADRAALLDAQRAAEQAFDGRAVPRPPGWGGYRLVPERVELWQQRTDRLHDRLVWTRGDGVPVGAASSWTRVRIQP